MTSSDSSSFGKKTCLRIQSTSPQIFQHNLAATRSSTSGMSICRLRVAAHDHLVGAGRDLHRKPFDILLECGGEQQDLQ